MHPVKPSFHPGTTVPSFSNIAANDAIEHTKDPKIVGTSVLGVKYKDGVILAADNLGILTITVFSYLRIQLVLAVLPVSKMSSVYLP
jgi:hypothetical protein